VTGDPAGEGTLRVARSILNIAAQLEAVSAVCASPSPIASAASIGTRDFEPFEYLGQAYRQASPAPGERVRRNDGYPGFRARTRKGFEIDVCLRGGR